MSKNNPKLDAYGTIDELNAFIGLLIEEISGEELRNTLQNIQSLLFVIGSILATESGKETLLHVNVRDTEMLEKEIDIISSDLPGLKGFILPGGSRSAAVSHICRTISRRAEREIYNVNDTEAVDPRILTFINRLSDYFFVLARKLNQTNKKQEIIWKKSCE